MDGHPGIARFPAISLATQAEFIEARRALQDRLDARHLHEAALLAAGDTLIRPGTCAPCLRGAAFTTRLDRWPRAADGSRMANWPEGQICDCADRLDGRARAVVHFAQAVAGLRPWTRLLLFGPEQAAHRRLAALAGEAVHAAALLPGDSAPGWTLPAPGRPVPLAVAIGCLHLVPPLDAALAAFRAALAPGGSFVFTVPFRYDASATLTRADLPRPGGRLPALLRTPAHDIGWDILDRLRRAGFAHAAAHFYWSGELGYLGAFNMIFHAAL